MSARRHALAPPIGWSIMPVSPQALWLDNTTTTPARQGLRASVRRREKAEPADNPGRCQMRSSRRPPREWVMVDYPKYTTTVIGAHSVPRWYEALDRLVGLGQLVPGDFADAQFRVMQGAIIEQEVAGIDIVTGGETHRRTHNRHSPPNAMLNHFWQKIPAFQGETRPKPITAHDPNVTHPAATCRGTIGDNTDLGLVDEFKAVSEFARKPVKVTMTGPHLLAAVAYDEHYGDLSRMMVDLSKLLRRNFQWLAEAGCKHIQVDEPYFTPVGDDEVAAAVEAINLAIEDLPEDVHVSVHICQGNYAVGPDYDGQIGHRYFDAGRYKADLVCRIDCDSL